MGRSARWGVSFAATVVLILISYEWLDQPIAFFAHARFHGMTVFPFLAQVAEWLLPVSVVAFALIALRALAGCTLSRPEAVILLSGVSLAVTMTVKDQLKLMFGRTWPEPATKHGPSLIGTGDYGFHPFHGGRAYASFPSGHTAAVCAVVAVFWVFYPQLRPLCVLIVATVAVGLLGGDYHFVSDIIAGGFLGASMGWLMVLFWESSSRLLMGSVTKADAPAGLAGASPAHRMPRQPAESAPG